MSREDLRSAAAAEVDRWEQLVHDELLRLFDRQEAVVLARLQGTKARKHTRHWEPPSDRPLEVKAIIDRARWVKDAAGSLQPLMRRMFRSVYGRVTKRFGGQERERDGLEEAVNARLDLIAKGVQTAVDEVEAFIAREEEAGEPMATIVERLRAFYEERKPLWAQRIATVNTVGSINQAALFAAEDAGSASKQWLSRRDERVRDTHEAADGQVRRLAEKFRLGGIPTHPKVSRLMYPGDPTAPLDETINCRCTMLFSPPRKDDGLALEEKADMDLEDKGKRRVRTPSGQRTYGQPIGSVIVADPNVPSGRSGGRGRSGGSGSAQRQQAMLDDRTAGSLKVGEVFYDGDNGPYTVAAVRPSAGRGRTVVTLDDGSEMRLADDAHVYVAGAPRVARTPAAPSKRKTFGKIGGLDVTLDGRDPAVRQLLADHAAPNDPPDPATTEVLVLRDHRDRVAAYVAWQIADGPEPKGSVVAISVHPSQRGKKLGDQMTAFIAQADPDVKPKQRAPKPARVAKPSRSSSRSPRALGPDGSPVIDSRAAGDKPGPSGDYDADVDRIARLQKAYMRDGADTSSLFSRGGRWSRERERQQQEIIDHFLSRPGVKKDRKILVVGGLPGAGKTTAITSKEGQDALGIKLDEYVVVNADEVKAEMVKRGMVPDYPGLTADESATLYHAESFEVAHALMRQSAREGYNFSYDTSLKSAAQLSFATGAGGRSAPPPYETTLLFVDVPPSVAKQRARDRYEAGGRFMPPALIDGMKARGSKRSSGPAENFDSVKGSVDRWVLMDNTGAAPSVVDTGAKRSRSAPKPAPLAGAVPAAAVDPDDVHAGDDDWADSEAAVELVAEGKPDPEDEYYDDPNPVYRPAPKPVVAAASDNDGVTPTTKPKPTAMSDGTLYAMPDTAPPKQHLDVVRGWLDEDDPAAKDSIENHFLRGEPAYRWRDAVAWVEAERGIRDDGPSAPKPAAPAKPAAADPDGLNPNLPAAPAGALIYTHPQGKTIYVLPDGSLEVWKPDGKRGTSSATAAKLAAGHGGWTLAAAAPTAPAPKPAARAAAPSVPLVAAAAAPQIENKPAPAPRGSLPVTPMDFNEADLADVPKYIADDDWIFQQKVDGIRGVLVLEPGQPPWFANKKGERLKSSTAEAITKPMLGRLPSTVPDGMAAVRIEGELLNGKFHIFDMVLVGQEDLPYEQRQAMAESWAKASGLPQAEALPVASSSKQKQALWDAVQASGAEGVMMKRRDARYSGGQRVNHTLKAKITATADVVVLDTRVGGKENATIGLRVGGKIVPIGNVSILGKGPINKGDVVEVEYLWATTNNTLAQPRIVRRRADKTEADVTDSSQLRLVDKAVLGVAQKALALVGLELKGLAA